MSSLGGLKALAKSGSIAPRLLCFIVIAVGLGFVYKGYRGFKDGQITGKFGIVHTGGMAKFQSWVCIIVGIGLMFTGVRYIFVV